MGESIGRRMIKAREKNKLRIKSMVTGTPISILIKKKREEEERKKQKRMVEDIVNNLSLKMSHKVIPRISELVLNKFERYFPSLMNRVNLQTLSSREMALEIAKHIPLGKLTQIDSLAKEEIEEEIKKIPIDDIEGIIDHISDVNRKF